MKRTVYFSLLFIFCSFAYAQVNQAAPAGSKYAPGQTQALVNQLLRDTCLDKKFSLVFYIMQDSSYSLPNNTVAMNSYSITQAVAMLNEAFSRICVSFEHCKTVLIPNYSYNEWTYSQGNLIVQNWYTENTINIYLPKDITSSSPDIGEAGYSYTALPTPATLIPVNAIILPKTMVMASNASGFQGHNLLHQFGHFFGLPHTWDEINPAGASTVIPGPPLNGTLTINTLEYVNRANMQNCAEHGDGFCDTEADPYPAVAATNTLYSAPQNFSQTLGLKDGHGDFYVPPWDNIMSTYKGRCHFSQQQYNYMAYFILTRRMYLH